MSSWKLLLNPQLFDRNQALAVSGCQSCDTFRSLTFLPGY
jgi:hypothetical protein